MNVTLNLTVSHEMWRAELDQFADQLALLKPYRPLPVMTPEGCLTANGQFEIVVDFIVGNLTLLELARRLDQLLVVAASAFNESFTNSIGTFHWCMVPSLAFNQRVPVKLTLTSWWRLEKHCSSEDKINLF